MINKGYDSLATLMDSGSFLYNGNETFIVDHVNGITQEESESIDYLFKRCKFTFINKEDY